ncbi:hypothetical protein BKN38_03960 [Helicobacter sp. CLO-3]|nr:hypothetical protein BA723_03890 [Helicobacter sp. CLO-3]OHU84074.1 hypothetical protein BKN38_03960 [Helicobacter sp. CLO-3]
MTYLGVFGNPIAHSLSPLLHNAVLSTLGINAVYGRFKLENGENLRQSFFDLRLSGANITLPFKEHAYKQADILDPTAKEIGAINTLVLDKTTQKLIGYNTDTSGFLATLLMAGKGAGGAGGGAKSKKLPESKSADFGDSRGSKDSSDSKNFANVLTDDLLGALNSGAPSDLRACFGVGLGIDSALILGAGGSAKALAYILHQKGVRVLVANRSPKAEYFASKGIAFCTFDELESIAKVDSGEADSAKVDFGKMDSGKAKSSEANSKKSDSDKIDSAKRDAKSDAKLDSTSATPNARFDLILNATSASIKNDLPLAESTLRPLLSRAKLAYDLMYGTPSPFLNLAKSLDIACKDGADMLIMQAVFALKLFIPEIDINRAYSVMSAVFPRKS